MPLEILDPGDDGFSTLSTRRFVVVSAGVGAPSSSRLLADRLANKAVAHLAELGLSVELTNVELREHAVDIARNLIQGFGSPSLEEVVETVAFADGAIFVTPILSASYSGLFKSFIDILPPHSIEGLPVLIGATGGSERHSLAIEFALRPLLAHLRAVVVPTGVFAATGDWGSTGNESIGSLPQRIDRAAEQLAVLVSASPRMTHQPALGSFGAG